MPDTKPVIREGYKSSHELAKELLAGPDLTCVLSMPVFDAPGLMHALPVTIEQMKIEDMDCIVIRTGKRKEKL